MKLYVNGTTLTVKNAWAEREGSVITLFVTVPYAEMDYSALKELFKSNTEDMIKTLDDGTEETFTADFAYSKITDDDASELYIVTLTSDENAYQLGVNRQLMKDNADLNSKVTAKDSEIATLNTSITEKNGTITEQGEKIVELEATIVSKDEEIAELLTIAEEYADMVFASLEESEVM